VTPVARIVSALLVAGLVLVACAPETPLTASVAGQPVAAATPIGAAPEVPLADPQVFVEGDSLTVGVATYLSGLLSLVGRPLTVDAQVGRTTAEGITMLSTRTSEIGGTLVVALGTNDDPDPAAFAARIDQVMIVASGRRVIWVTVARAGWDRLDDALLAAPSRWANLEVIDWRPVIAAHPDLRASDGIHLTLEGYQLRAEFIAAAVQAHG
jgi:lysophospholipase L1-like esterase